MQDLNDMVTFARVAEAGSFSEAARRTNSGKSSVSKAIARLERALGARLINRSTRGLSLTEVGEAYYEHCRRIVAEAAQAENVVDHHLAKPRGVLKVTTSVAFGTLQVTPALPDFLARYPDIAIDMTIIDRVIDLAEEGFDLGIRITSQPDPDLVVRSLAPVRRVICATPEYFQRHGTPQQPADLAQHNCLHYTALPTFIVGNDLQSGRLQAVLQDYLPVEQEVTAVFLPNTYLPPKIRVFIDFLQERFGPEPFWDQPRPKAG